MRKLITTFALLLCATFAKSQSLYDINYANNTLSIIGVTDTTYSKTSNNFSYTDYYPTQIKFVGFSGTDLYFNTDEINEINGVAISQPITAVDLIAYLDSIILLPTTYSDTATLDFTNTQTARSRDLTITVTGADAGDVVILGVPFDAVTSNTCYTAYVSSTNTVTVRFNNYSLSASDPAPGLFKVTILK